MNEDETLLADVLADLVHDVRPRSTADLDGTGEAAERAGELLDTGGYPTMRGPGGDASTTMVAIVTHALARALVPVPFALRQIAYEATRAADPGAGEGRATVALDGGLGGWGPAEGAVAVDALGVAAAITVRGGRVLSVDVVDTAHGVDPGRALGATGGRVRDLGPITAEQAAAVDAFALALIAADQVGTARGALDEALEHVRGREQFGRPVGAFQAIRHLAADAEVALAAAHAIAHHAARRVDDVAPDQARRIAAAAKALCDEVAVEVCESAVQMLGGIAMTWDHLAHARLRRALLNRRLFGGPHTHFATPEPLDPRLDLADSAAERDFRAALRTWLAARPAERPGDADAPRSWHRALHAAGYVGASLPVGAGGRGLGAAHEAVVNEEIGAADRPPAPAIGHLAHALRLHGQARRLPALLSGDERWCQGFSEPGAGSDLAAITTKAVRRPDGSHVVDGAKIWTSGAVEADRCLLLCRTAGPHPGRPRHEGLSVLLVDMRSPGVEVRPIRTAFDTTEFAQVHFDAVVVPAEDLLGAPGDGWRIAMDMLGYERGPADIGWVSRIGRTITRLRADIAECPDLPDARIRVGRAEAWLCALQIHVRERVRARDAGTAPGAEGSIDKLLLTRVDQLARGLRLELASATALTEPGDDIVGDYLWSRAASIYGGTSQIQRDIVGHRVLGLPRG